MNTSGFVISFIFLVSCISTLWGIISYDANSVGTKEAVKSGLYAFSAICGIALTIAVIIELISA